MSPAEVDALFLSRLAEADASRREDHKILPRINCSGSCWLWTGATVVGYGIVNYDGEPCVYLHRLALALTSGLPDGMCACHNCPGGDTRNCCRPSHLFAATAQENTRDAAAKGQLSSGARHPRPGARLSVRQVAEIKALLADGERGASIARAFGISVMAVSRIKTGQAWSHVSPANDLHAEAV